MTGLSSFTSSYHSVLHLVLEAVSDHAVQNRPSPTIKQISMQIGHSEETILESLEYGMLEQVSILQ
ncbi:hypothetical protein [Alkalicoccus daliensis]|uniref:Uncharacterized protein n=1 Tax=Alkalicoccus daliensis TaxID=745820 RepID=A0A1H0B2C0_9BACI|nr:hypothetical protein [Alkalicoccus daliensis]SDN39798.1 hypothetical protein SAMN04488053_101724 [Alkalicoccus daliensis]